MENKTKYNIEIIIKKCDSIEDKKQFIDYISEILKEKQNSFLYQLYSIKNKDFIIKTLEKTLKIMNEGGILKKNINEEDNSETTKNDNSNNIRTVGGTFIHLVKTSDVLTKDELKTIFWRNKKKKEMKRKLYKSLNKLNLNININIGKKDNVNKK
jgi:hypothetical protein